MSDLIKQAKEYADLSEVITTTFYDDENEEWSIKSTTIRDVLDTVCDDYTVFPSTQQWIPVTDRLPEEDGHYIVAVKNGLFPNNVLPIDILRYEGGKWKYYFGFENDGFEDPITAWMPLPDPYEGGEPVPK